MPMVFAQDGSPTPARSTQPGTGSVMVWVGVLILAAMVGGGIWVWLRRQLLAPESAGRPATIMEDLRRMRDEGQITQEEYDSIRRNMATRLAQSGFGVEKPTPGAKPPRDGR
jgi:hypothetical protein